MKARRAPGAPTTTPAPAGASEMPSSSPDVGASGRATRAKTRPKVGDPTRPPTSTTRTAPASRTRPRPRPTFSWGAPMNTRPPTAATAPPSIPCGPSEGPGTITSRSNVGGGRVVVGPGTVTVVVVLATTVVVDGVGRVVEVELAGACVVLVVGSSSV